MNRAIVLLLATAPQFVLVAGLALREELARAAGQEVVLEVRAVDPMDALSGRYVSTPLAITRIELRDVPHDTGLGDARTAWVVIAPGGTYWEPVAVRRERPDAQAGQACLRASVESIDEREGVGILSLEYPIERFYIPAEGRDPSLAWPGAGGARLAVRAKVTPSGYASIVDLLVDGVPYAEWNR